MKGEYERNFGILLVLVSIAFVAVLWPFLGAILWGVVLAVLFLPLHRRLRARLGGRETIAALATVFVVIALVIIPFAMLATVLVKQAAGVYARVQSGEIDVGAFFRQVFEALPGWATSVLDRFGLTDYTAVQERVSAELGRVTKFLASQAVAIGQNTLDFLIGLAIVLYLLFFLLRDGQRLFRRIREATPLAPEQQDALFERFLVVTRATMKGTFLVAIVQGVLGGIIFAVLGIQGAVLWGVVMAILSLLPAVGTALVWGPVAIWLFATGAAAKGAILLAFGVLVIGSVDNVLRPLLVGKDTKLPDYVVLISTLGGLALFGANGFLIGPLIAAIFIAAWDLYRPARRGSAG